MLRQLRPARIQVRSSGSLPRKIRLPTFAKEMKRRKISSTVLENGGMRARTDSLHDSLSHTRVVNDPTCPAKDLFSISLEAP